jgi:hypothetical protein
MGFLTTLLRYRLGEVIGNRFSGIGEQVDQEPVNCGPKISSNSISPNSYNMKLVYYDWDWAVKRSDDKKSLFAIWTETALLSTTH